MATRRVRWAVVALVVVAAAVGLPGWPSGPASAATTTLTLETTLTKTLGPVQQTTGTGQAWSSPAIGDVTGDGVPEIVVAMLDGTVRAYRTSNHSLVWTKALTAAIQSSPVLADLNGDRVSEVVVATMAGRVVLAPGIGRLGRPHVLRGTAPLLPGRPGLPPARLLRHPDGGRHRRRQHARDHRGQLGPHGLRLEPLGLARVPPLPRGHPLEQPGGGRHRQQRRRRDHPRRRHLARQPAGRARRRPGLGAQPHRLDLPRLSEVDPGADGVVVARGRRPEPRRGARHRGRHRRQLRRLGPVAAHLRVPGEQPGHALGLAGQPGRPVPQRRGGRRHRQRRPAGGRGHVRRWLRVLLRRQRRAGPGAGAWPRAAAAGTSTRPTAGP